ncbi:methyltransferase [Streptomyces griseocarneus]|uniref:methyltransferase n=1 Tax=Streptomyces griseocarneus TaxID=51201 RepID=UPI00167C766A|nr:methyltransferase [Streptomyces griseocarneus]MBZ6477619.1 methyltransferase [Streptomyces griseocarneus]GHG83270.1 O-methyltransferase [Streptomyces griseocarneus]
MNSRSSRSDRPDQTAEGAGAGQVMDILFGHWRTELLLTAVESDLFTHLSGAPATAEELAARLGYRLPGAESFFVGLVGLGLLETEDGRFVNAPAAEQHLVRGRPGYMGGYLQFCRRELNPSWDGLGTALRTGLPQNRAAREGNPYHSLYEDKSATDLFLDSMDMFNSGIASHLADLDWSRYTSFVDVGGARGNIAHELASRHPHLTGEVFDLPPLESSFTEHMAALGGAGRVSFHGGDFFADPLPEADVLIFGHVLHNWGPEDRLRLLRSAYAAVRPGGAVIVYDPMVGDAVPSLYATLASLSMLVWSNGGREYSVDECHAWLKETGFRPETVALPDGVNEVLVVAHKDR